MRLVKGVAKWAQTAMNHLCDKPFLHGFAPFKYSLAERFRAATISGAPPVARNLLPEPAGERKRPQQASVPLQPLPYSIGATA